MWLAAVPLSDR